MSEPLSGTPPQTSYEPMTREQIESLRTIYLDLNLAVHKGEFDRLCSMAVSSLLYGEEIQRLRGDNGRAIANHAADLTAIRSERTRIEPPTEDEIDAYRDLFRAELSKRMDTNHPSASPSTEAHQIALTAFVRARNAKAGT